LKKTLSVLVLIPLLAGAGYLAFKPIPINPKAYTVAANPGYTGDHATNTKLAGLKTLKIGGEVGPETVAIGPDGMIYSGGESGNVYRINPDGSGQTVYAYAGGRVLGLAFDAKGNLICADAERGLLSITPEGIVYVLTNHFGGELLLFTDAVAVAKSGKIYYTDASTQFGPVKSGSTMEASILDLMDGTPTGRVFEFDPETKKSRLIAHGLSFANGIALSDDETTLFVNETGRFRVWKIATSANQLDIAKADTQKSVQATVLLDNLPGYPDNLTRGTDGKIWLGFAAQRTNDLDRMATMPWMRKVVLRLPRSWWPIPKPYGHVMAFTEDGKVVADLQDPSGAYPETTGVTETKDRLYIQSLHAKNLGWMEKQ
jgi:sugar lactone lactonase YvrE